MPGKNDIRILVVDDEPDVLELVVYHLEKEAYRVDVADTGDKALKMARENLPSLLVLDLMLPGINGLEICRLLKRDPKTRDIPILMLTARAAEEDRIKGLESGADDYLGKPFDAKELILRIRSILKRTVEQSKPTDGRIVLGNVAMDEEDHTVSIRDTEVPFTVTEFKLLQYFLKRKGRVQTRETLLISVWKFDADIETRTVDVHIRRLRKKMGAADLEIETVRGVGYRLVEKAR